MRYVDSILKILLLLAFSHSSVSEFLFWGFDNPAKADIYTENWEYGAMGEAFFELVHDKWMTNLVSDTNKKGALNGRGFYGTYNYTCIDGDKVIKGSFDFLPNQKKSIEINIDK